MASSSERGGARALGALPPALPPPEEVAAFYALVEKETTAGMLSLHTRAAELSGRAARKAERLWGDNSLVVAHLRLSEVSYLREIACASTSSSEQVALLQRAWAILVPVQALLLRRLADNTLLPGTIKEEEVMYDVRWQAFICKAKDKPVPSEAVLQGVCVLLGYTTLLKAVAITLVSLIELRGEELPRESVHSFVLTALDAIPLTATMQTRCTSENGLVAVMETHMNPQNFEPHNSASPTARTWAPRPPPRPPPARRPAGRREPAREGWAARRRAARRACAPPAGAACPGWVGPSHQGRPRPASSRARRRARARPAARLH